jgi:hypothetical protein
MLPASRRTASSAALLVGVAASAALSAIVDQLQGTSGPCLLVQE